MQWYEKDPCFHRSFPTGTIMKQSKNYLVCSRRCFPIFTTTEYHGFSLYTVQNEEIQNLPPLVRAWPSFLNSPHRSQNPKNFRKIGVYADLIHAQGAFRVQNLNHAATTTPHRSRFQSYDIHIFIIVLKDVSTHIVESVVSYHSHDYINRTRAHVLIYAINIALLSYIGSCAPVPYV